MRTALVATVRVTMADGSVRDFKGATGSPGRPIAVR